MKPWLRWILVLPAAVGAYVLLQLALVLASVVVPGGLIGDLWTQFLGSVLCPCAYVAAGSKTAPAHRFITAIVLTLLLAIGETIIATLVILQKRQGGMSLFWLIACGVVGLAGAVVVCLEMRKQEERDEVATQTKEESRTEDTHFSNN